MPLSYQREKTVQIREMIVDQTDRLAAATIVAGMLTGEHTLLGDRSFKNWPSIAKACFDCAQALSVEQQSRRWKLEGGEDKE